MNLIARSVWGARPPKSRTPLDRRIQRGTAVHYSASDADEQSQHTNCAGRVRSIQAFHMNSRGWADIAYSYLVCKHGFTFEGRGLGWRTAANGTTLGNDRYHAVCFLGDDTAGRDDVTETGRRAIRDTIALCNGWSQTANEAAPHSRFKATACPGDDLRSWIVAGLPIQEDGDLPFTEKQLRTMIAQEVREQLRVATGPDDASVPASVWFDTIRREIAAIKAAVVPPSE